MNEEAHSRDRAKEYQRTKQILMLVHLVLTLLVLILAFGTPLSRMMKAWAVQIWSNPYGMVFLYFTFFSVYMLFFDLPFSYYSGFILEHRYELSNQTLKDWSVDFLKKSLISFGLSILLLELLYALIWQFPNRWWVFAWAGYAFISYIIGKVFPVLIVPLFYKYGKVENEDLKRMIFDLCHRFRLPVKNIFSLNLSKTTKKANAAFMGFGRTKRVVLSDTLIDNFTNEEIGTVVAHELGHYQHRDIWKILIFGVVSSFFAFGFVYAVIGQMAPIFGLDGARDVASLPLLFLIFYLFYLVLMPMQNGYSRRLERAADRFALEAMPSSGVFISCMQKLAQLNLADPEPHPVIEWIFYDHPSIGKRVDFAKKWDQKLEG